MTNRPDPLVPVILPNGDTDHVEVSLVASVIASSDGGPRTAFVTGLGLVTLSPKAEKLIRMIAPSKWYGDA